MRTKSTYRGARGHVKRPWKDTIPTGVHNGRNRKMRPPRAGYTEFTSAHAMKGRIRDAV